MSDLILTVGDIRKAIEGCQDNDLVIGQIIPKDGKVFVFPIRIGKALMNDSVLVVTVKHELIKSLVLED